MKKNETVDLIHQEKIIDKKDCTVSSFLVLRNLDTKEALWFSQKRLNEILKHVETLKSGEPYSLLLKPFYRGNPDEGLPSKLGKAVRIQKEDDVYSFIVYTSEKRNVWEESTERYRIESSLFETYLQVLQNDHQVDLLVKEMQEESSLQLGGA